MIQKFKKYQNQLALVFKRFPIVIGYVIYATISFICFYQITDNAQLFFEKENLVGKLTTWLLLYPLPAMALAYTMKLMEEVHQKKYIRQHIIAQASWVFIFILYLIFPSDNRAQYLTSIGFLLLASPFIVPFWKKKTDISLWKFGAHNIKSAIISALITGVLNGSIIFLFYAIKELFEVDISEHAFVITAIICWTSIFPILFLAGVPQIETVEDVRRSKFTMNVIHFLFIPVFLLYIAFLYAYGIKIIFFDADYDTVSAFASIATLSMLVICTILYPSHFDSERKIDHKILIGMPLSTLPLVIFMTVDVVHSITTERLETEFVYFLYLALWYYVLITLSCFCTKKKLRFIIISLCTAVILSFWSPLNAVSLSKKSVLKELTDLLNKHGYTEFPLDCQKYQAFYKEIKEGDTTELVNFESLRHYISYEFDKSVIEQYLPPEYSFCREDSEEEKEESKTIGYAASTLVTGPIQIPANRSKAIIYDNKVNEDYVEIKDSVLTFQITPNPDDSTSRHTYTVPLDTLKSREEKDGTQNPLILEDETSTFIIQEFDLLSNMYLRNLSLRGILFLK